MKGKTMKTTAKDREVKNRLISFLTNDKSLKFSDKIMTVKDIVYLLGISYDKEKYQYATGFIEFTKNVIVILLNTLTDEDRKELINCYCVHCGSKDLKCQCNNDE